MVKKSRTTLKKGTICKLLKSKRLVECYNKKGEMIAAYVVKGKK